MICYVASPNPYLTDFAPEIAKVYDGLFFSVGSWDSGVLNALGVAGVPAKDTSWFKIARKNLIALKKAGVTENLLTIYFGSNEVYPSPETVLSAVYTEKLAQNFAAIGKAAKELGFVGVCIDTEYPYPRYEVDHEIYTYVNYTADDLMTAAKIKGRAAMTAILDNFPEAVIFQLPEPCSPGHSTANLSSDCWKSWPNATPPADFTWERNTPTVCTIR